MDTLQLTQVPVMKTGMLIRKPVAEVFEAFVNPDITTQFWFTRSSGRLAPGAQVEWAWEMYDVSASVMVKAIEPNRQLVIQWPGYSGLSTVEWLFTPHTDDITFVLTQSGALDIRPEQGLSRMHECSNFLSDGSHRGKPIGSDRSFLHSAERLGFPEAFVG